jgi:hypothetical protein
MTKDQFVFGQFEYAKERISHNLGLFVDDRGNDLITAVSYKKAAFEYTIIEDITTRFKALITHVISNPDCKVSELGYSPGKKVKPVIADKDLQFNF